MISMILSSFGTEPEVLVRKMNGLGKGHGGRSGFLRVRVRACCVTTKISQLVCEKAALRNRGKSSSPKIFN